MNDELDTWQEALEKLAQRAKENGWSVERIDREMLAISAERLKRSGPDRLTETALRRTKSPGRGN